MVVKTADHYFEIVVDYKEAFNQEQFDNRYSEVLDKYPIIVGDIGYEQLRLKGFYEDKNKKADISRRFSSIQDYLMEYCNFGCPYFVLRRLTEHEMVRLTAEDVEDEVELNSEEMVEQEEVQTETIIEDKVDASAKTLKHFLK
ncbi:DUF1027 domain-containing protein [Macrococcus hajekii]|uniref:DUF1027 domain-containing protein n=1 Tax=Macrococcus hajekii TaxID=198482 RepID=A0A4R6BNZ3_9STAP|nr:YutD family protein [Macrococcus hajekii]TDM03498.1 DUF1027 domain-containing protein [Macrococcus hajekii]GGA99340.1 hypothetical protein GCM10007190_04230 [Macrococcus hajekii]